MAIATLMVLIIIGMSFLTMVAFVVFGQVTVRKLRRMPQLKDKLGVELASGWDILNVAGALSRPKWLTKKFNQSKLVGLTADSDALHKYTSPFDRLLGRIFWTLYMTTGTFTLVALILNVFGLS